MLFNKYSSLVRQVRELQQKVHDLERSRYDRSPPREQTPARCEGCGNMDFYANMMEFSLPSEDWPNHWAHPGCVAQAMKK